MRLGELVAGLRAATWPKALAETEITGIQYDSRVVEPGDLFCAVPGFHTDGHLYCGEAVARGARALLVERAVDHPQTVAMVAVPEVRAAMAVVADRFYGQPSAKLYTVGVTGTNGKTTTTHLIRAVLEAGGVATGLTGTIQTLIGAASYPVVHTTPEAPDLQRILAEMVRAGMRAVVMEVSSHALALKRVDQVRYDLGVFTNLTQDHLDFHKDLEDYFQAKALLFRRLPAHSPKGPAAAVINQEDAFARRLADLTPAPVVRYGWSEGADVRASEVAIESGGVRFRAEFPDGRTIGVRFPMTGRFNVLNALAALTVGFLWGVEAEVMAQALERFSGVPGRFERVDEGQPYAVIVDYAHTPDGIENVLKTAREFAKGRVIAVFGAGGDRDRRKRPLMGAAAGRIADHVIITSDNPRSEDPLAIIRDIEEGIRDTGVRWQTEPDRARAIRLALEMAKPDDVVMILGKGHETYQINRHGTIHFDDREEARKALKELWRR
ncbi:MAG: UDP-N-acetylmuramoyl-L-alanyl-D-glutamate--2,6-diaminopimelate ligase [Firmicutes bacterium]|nr:UDP-N-acetylmuramoyl-L-alanyl-D-glutamate--2,6-diaminopimelate ligase [Alicyclobacillaceae bacterium]MCL6497787.1 UDP-N-acetylmuramoyl-L-alanyl-D-glutamate--2,6-diaminopimelate ligase [Bacillota bacterium]